MLEPAGLRSVSSTPSAEYVNEPVWPLTMWLVTRCCPTSDSFQSTYGPCLEPDWCGMSTSSFILLHSRTSACSMTCGTLVDPFIAQQQPQARLQQDYKNYKSLPPVLEPVLLIMSLLWFMCVCLLLLPLMTSPHTQLSFTLLDRFRCAGYLYLCFSY